jgi:hypothetical protein
VSHALDAVIDAALDRALVDASDARRYFALAGALERVAPQAGGSRNGPDTDCSGSEPPAGSFAGAPGDPLGAALTSTVAVRALTSTRTGDIDPDAWFPGGNTGDADLVAAGAAAACRRFDVDPDRVAARSGVSRERLCDYPSDET